jgi:hypothetical protein
LHFNSPNTVVHQEDGQTTNVPRSFKHLLDLKGLATEKVGNSRSFHLMINLSESADTTIAGRPETENIDDVKNPSSAVIARALELVLSDIRKTEQILKNELQVDEISMLKSKKSRHHCKNPAELERSFRSFFHDESKFWMSTSN